jgi:hypothetical protein
MITRLPRAFLTTPIVLSRRAPRTSVEVKRRKSPISKSALPRGPPILLLRLAIAALPLEDD